ncbi:LolA family protein [Paenisporosarcina cavernae]|uniref:Outer membrane lipoprotein carrier protein LolA n=1 Tax=Paenisporosarcina cavernae TaxID=2320858 RepID=A0A385YUK5_9BACL|nr:outer membrane lipoprotein carrier protein LolA [Paenisporosarcina cavernae]AYC30366.1 outer membrane lipoprotein carrier protein LolA [Paenisporosarcina cavernae]
MKKRWAWGAVLVLLGSLLSGCGKDSPEEVLEKVTEKWVDTKGYDAKAKMEIRTGTEARVYDVDVWHTKPDFFRVNVTQNEEEMMQTITRNKDGVFVSSPTLGKTYKFKSDWPQKNSQAYLIGSLAGDLAADKSVKMEETKKSYIFHTATRNNQKELLPSQDIIVSKKTLLPTKVLLFDQDKKEQIILTFEKITLGKTRAASDFDVNMEQSTDEEKAVSADMEVPELKTHYPTMSWEGVTKLDEKVVKSDAGDRIILTYGGDRSFTIIQSSQPIETAEVVPVFAAGDPADLGVAIGAITENSVAWEHDGMHFFLASNSMTQEEMIAVAASLQPETVK